MIEYRTVGGSAAASEGVLNGLVTPFNIWTNIGDVKRGGFKERISPGTFAKTLQERDVVLINNHDTGQPMARTSVKDGPGSLSLTEDSSAGLRARAIPVDTSYARDVMALAEAGVVRGMSFGFEVIKDSWTDDEGRASNAQVGTQRTIHEVRLFEVTTTAFPAYETTELSARDAISAAREGRAAKEPKPYGDVKYADSKNGKYPVDTEKHAKAAWAYINVPKNADEYPLNGVTLESVRDEIKKALEHFGVEISEDERTLWAWLTETRSGVPGPAHTDDGDAPDYSGDGDKSGVRTCAECGTRHDCKPSQVDIDDAPNNGLQGADLMQDPTRTSEPAETTRDEESEEEYRAEIERLVAEAIRTR